MHSAYQVGDLDALAAGGEYLRERGYHRSWGIGRHIQGSQIFDYWRDPDGFLVEHFSRRRHVRHHPGAGLGAVHRLRAGAVGTAGHRRTSSASAPRRIPDELRSMISALRDNNEFDASPACAAS